MLQVVTPISFLKNVILGSSLQYRSALVATRMRSLFFLSPTNLTDLHRFLRPVRSGGIKGTQISLMTQIFELCGIRWCLILFGSSLQYRSSKITPSLFTIKEGSTSHLGLLPSGKKRETALLGARNRYALRLADHQRSSPDCAGWDRRGKRVYNL